MKQRCTKHILFLALLIFLCTSCGLLPAEDPVLQPPVIKSYESPVTKFATVVRGDLIKEENIRVSYVAAKEEVLTFPISDIVIKSIYVNVGDSVTSGQILAELDRDFYINAIADTRYKIEQIELSKKLTYNGGAIQAGEYDARLKQLNIELEDYIIQSELRVIRATFDGTVTYVKSFQDGEVSREKERNVVIADKSLSVFYTFNQNAALYEPGDIVEINVGSVPYEATVVLPESIGVISPKPDNVYFKLNELADDLKETSSGTIKLILDQRLDVLYLPTAAVKTVNENSFVYVMDGNVKKTIDVETGLTAGRFVEIVKGLSEGDSVVLED